MKKVKKNISHKIMGILLNIKKKSQGTRIYMFDQILENLKNIYA